MHIHICVYMHTPTHMAMCLYMCAHTSMHVPAHGCAAPVCTQVHAHVDEYMCVHTWTYVYMHMHVCVCICTCVCVCAPCVGRLERYEVR